MFLKSKLFRFVSVFMLILSLAPLALADTIRLKNGSIIKGKIVQFSNGKFVIIVGEGSRQKQFTYTADEVESIKFDNAMPSTNTAVKSDNSDTSKPSYTKTVEGNNTIIRVGSAPKNNDNKVIRAKKDIPANTSNKTSTTKPKNDNSNANTSRPNIKPIQIKVKVFADDTANGWTNSGWVVRKGQKIRIFGNGRISLGNGRYSSPAGIQTLPDPQKLIKDKPTGSLIAVIGDDNNDFIHIGANNEFIAKRDGALFLGVNEYTLKDNSGSFEVIVEIDPNIVK